MLNKELEKISGSSRFMSSILEPGVRANDPAMTMKAIQTLTRITTERPHWIIGTKKLKSAIIPLVTPEWSRTDWWGQVKARMGSFRMNYSIMPGLYAIGTPDDSSDVFVSANYKLSFDILRRELKGINGWILVLDTKGINVWCAAGKGTFGTNELIKRILNVNLAEIVSHRHIIVPQLGAVGIKASEVKKKTGFHVYFGPVEACDIRTYLEADRTATPGMRMIRFTMLRRLILTPIELYQAMKLLPPITLGILVLFGLQPPGILFYNAWHDGWPYIFMCLISIVAGGFLTPVLLPFIPFRSFAAKGWIAGAAAIAPLVLLADMPGSSSLFFRTSALVLFPLLSSYLALQFTGATTYTGISGVKRELKIMLPVYISGAAVSFILLVLYKIQTLGLI